MKRILFVICAALSVFSCSTLQIAMNQTGSDGAKYLLTSNQPLFHSGRGNIDIALGTKIMGRDTVLAFLITCDANVGHGVFNQGNRLMFRLADGSEIFLSNVYDKEYEEHEETNVSNNYRSDYGYAYAYNPWVDDIVIAPFEVTRVVPQVRHYKVSNSYALYLVTKPQMWDLMTKDVKKLRVEIEDQDLDMPETAGVSQMFTDMINCLKAAVSDAPVRTKF